MEVAERNNPLQAEVHFRATNETNRFTILLNNMRVMGIFDWWLAVLDFISKSAPDPRFDNVERRDSAKDDSTDGDSNASDSLPDRNDTTIFMQEEPLYPSAGNYFTVSICLASTSTMHCLNLSRIDFKKSPSHRGKGTCFRVEAQYYRL